MRSMAHPNRLLPFQANENNMNTHAQVAREARGMISDTRTGRVAGNKQKRHLPMELSFKLFST
jgi:hypothetical protein